MKFIYLNTFMKIKTKTKTKAITAVVVGAIMLSAAAGFLAINKNPQQGWFRGVFTGGYTPGRTPGYTPGYSPIKTGDFIKDILDLK